ncbi:hypothetical protein Tco_0478098 [Tanacetum coccineum]
MMILLYGKELQKVLEEFGRMGKRFLKSDTGFGRKGNGFIRGNRYGGRGRGDMNKLRSNSRREMGCFGFGDKNHRYSYLDYNRVMGPIGVQKGKGKRPHTPSASSSTPTLSLRMMIKCEGSSQPQQEMELSDDEKV